MTEINGLRLAYRGLVTGLAAGWVWAATAMVGGLLIGWQPLLPLELLGGGSSRNELALGIAVAQLASGGIGMTFAYFFARYFTVRHTLAVAAPCFAVLAWLALGRLTELSATTNAVLLAATLLYGIMLGRPCPSAASCSVPTQRDSQPNRNQHGDQRDRQGQPGPPGSIGRQRHGDIR